MSNVIPITAPSGGGGGSGQRTPGGGGSGDGDGNMQISVADYVTGRLSESAANMNTKFESLIGEIKLSSATLSSDIRSIRDEIAASRKEIAVVMANQSTIKFNIVASGLAVGATVFALIFGLASYGQSMLQLATGLVQVGQGHTK